MDDFHFHYEVQRMKFSTYGAGEVEGYFLIILNNFLKRRREKEKKNDDNGNVFHSVSYTKNPIQD